MNRKATTTPTVDLDRTRQRLDRFGLLHDAEQLEGLISEAVKDNRATHQVIGRLLDVELDRREERLLQTSLRLSGLPTGQTLGTSTSSSSPRWNARASRSWPPASGSARTVPC